MSARHGLLLLPSLFVFVPLVAASSAVVDAVLLNQALAVALAGAFVASLPARSKNKPALATRTAVPWAALAGLALAALMAARRWRADAWPLDFGGLLAAGVVFGAAAQIAHTALPDDAKRLHTGLALGWWIAGLLCAAIALVQYFAPSLASSLFDGAVVAASGAPGRAVGNMRQPNHLATALVCAMVWTAWLAQQRSLPAWAASAGIGAMVLAVALSASRTGAVSLGVLLLWAAVDRRLPRGIRWLLALTPLVYLACWFGLIEWAALQQGPYYGADRLQSSSDPSSSRFAIWKNALALVAENPWTGVGWGRFNFAWTFTRFPDRPIAFFDHTHNLPLQLAVEVGIPATLLVLGLLGWALWRARSAWWNDERDDAGRCVSPARPALVMLAVLGVHSLLEYPLWYAYFLLPAAWALGLFIGSAAPEAQDAQASVVASGRPSSWQPWLLRAGGLAMIVGSLYTLGDHRRIEAIFEAKPGAAPLAERIAEGQRSVLFGHHADYAAVTNEPRDQRLETFRRPLLQLVDVRLLIAYIEALKAHGDDARALYAAQRLREFRREDAQAYFKDCDGPSPPFQCEREPVRGLTWREMLPD